MLGWEEEAEVLAGVCAGRLRGSLRRTIVRSGYHVATPDLSLVEELDACTLDDDTNLTGRDIVRYGYQGKETPVSSWVDMFEHVVKYLHGKDGSVLLGIAYGDGGELGGYFSGTPDRLHMPLEIGDGLYAEKRTSTAVKISILRRLFTLFREDPTDLAFYLRDSEGEESADEKRYALRKRYWEYALPAIKDANRENGCFDGCNPIVWNTTSGSFGMGGFLVNCVANKNEVRVVQKLHCCCYWGRIAALTGTGKHDAD